MIYMTHIKMNIHYLQFEFRFEIQYHWPVQASGIK